VTPTIMGAGESDAAREQRSARALFRMLADDAEHGAANKATMQGWLDKYTPQAVNAGRNLQPIWSQLSEKVVKFEDSFDRSRGRFEEIVGFLGLQAPKEVAA
jgi:propane monooxygenase small subunit